MRIAKAKLEYKQKPQQHTKTRSQKVARATEATNATQAAESTKASQAAKATKDAKTRPFGPQNDKPQKVTAITPLPGARPENQGPICNCLCAVVTVANTINLNLFSVSFLCVGTTVQVRWAALSDWPADSSIIGNGSHQIRQGTKRHKKCMQDSKQGRD